jgi:SpoVK/Ycf46/Vps4 family AAA+-type ATPase
MKKRRRLIKGAIRNEDKNDRFVRWKCSQYLERVLNHCQMINKELLTLLSWILGEDFREIGDYILDKNNVSESDAFQEGGTNSNDERDNPSGRLFSQFEETHADSFGDTDDYVNAVLRITQKSSQNIRYGIYLYIKALLTQERTRHKNCCGSEIEKNIYRVKKMFNLTEPETEFIIFLFINDNWTIAYDYFFGHLQCHKFPGRKSLRSALQVGHKQLDDVLTGTLARLEIFQDDSFSWSLEANFSKLFQSPGNNNFAKSFYIPISKDSVPLEHYFIKKEHKEHLFKILQRKPETSTHVLLYGPPGTGKTSFAYGIARHLKVPAYEVIRGGGDKTETRRAAIIACLNMTNKGDGSLIIVDEADNLLNTENSWFSRGETQDKAWLNKLLEESGTRMIWITNRIRDIDDSVIRRFCFSLHFKPFNRIQRVRLWESLLKRNKAKRMLGEAEICNLAQRYKVNAGVINLAVKKAREIRATCKKEFLESVITTLEANLALTKGGQLPLNKDKIENNYTLEGLNIEGDLKSMLTQLEEFSKYLERGDCDERKNINLLFYGPPGTGKSELARYIANSLDKTLISKRMSDILDPYVGISERKISEAFSEAEYENGILIFDEVDSLLYNRSRAQRSWEISFTNEFLTQMERFRGILICTTNRLNDLDNASIRRFNYKVGFNYLKPEGNIIFYKTLLGPLTDEKDNDEIMKCLSDISMLTPGDFRTVRDRFSFHPRKNVNHRNMVHALIEEVNLKRKQNGIKNIGF